MAVVSIFLVKCVLALALVVVTASEELLIFATYPDSGNFSYIELNCVYDMSSGPQFEGNRTKFQLNGTDIEEQIDEVEEFNGRVRFVLTPEKEGFFTCSLNGFFSNNSIGLAGMLIISAYVCRLVRFCVIYSSAQYELFWTVFDT